MRVSGIGLERGKEKPVDAEGLNVVETLNDSVEAAAAVGAEVDGIDLIDDGMFPPDVGIEPGAYPSGAGQRLRQGRQGDGEGESECEESARCRHDHRSR